MSNERQKLLADRKGSLVYTGLSRTDSSSSLNYLNRNTMAAKSKQIALLYNDLLYKATYPWKFIVRKLYAREFLAEFLGTFILVVIGNGAIAQTVLPSANGMTGVPQFGSFLNINLGYGLGLVLALYASIGVSGGHLNPAVTFAMAVRGQLCWIKVLPYFAAQFLGAFFAACVTYGVYVDAILSANCHNGTDPKHFLNCTAGIFATYPQGYLSVGNGFFDQFFGTFILVLSICAICDKNNSEPKVGLKPLLIGLVLVAIGLSTGLNGGYAINPARDLAPRIFTAMAGWGAQVFTCPDCSIQHWWWIPVFAPMLGGVAGALFYWAVIEAHHPITDKNFSKDEESQKLIPEPNINTPEQRASPVRDAEY